MPEQAQQLLLIANNVFEATENLPPQELRESLEAKVLTAFTAGDPLEGYLGFSTAIAFRVEGNRFYGLFGKGPRTEDEIGLCEEGTKGKSFQKLLEEATPETIMSYPISQLVRKISFDLTQEQIDFLKKPIAFLNYSPLNIGLDYWLVQELKNKGIHSDENSILIPGQMKDDTMTVYFVTDLHPHSSERYPLRFEDGKTKPWLIQNMSLLACFAGQRYDYAVVSEEAHAVKLAHIFRNLLSTTGGFSKSIEERMQNLENIPSEERIKRLEEIYETIARVKWNAAVVGRENTFAELQLTNYLGFYGKLHHHEKVFDPRETIEMVLKRPSRLEVYNQKRKINVSSTLDYNLDDMKADMDETLFGYLLWNIKENAYEAMGVEGNFTIRAYKGENQKDMIIEFSDTGKGIPPDVIHKVFHPSYSAYNRGLGLAFCKKIIDLYKGQLTIESELNKGTTVKVVLPNVLKVA